MADENVLGQAAVKITADLSDLQTQLNLAVSQAQAGAQQMATAFNSTVVPAMTEATTAIGALGEQLTLFSTEATAGLGELGAQASLFNSEMQNVAAVSQEAGAGIASVTANTQQLTPAVEESASAFAGMGAQMAGMLLTVGALKELFINTAEAFGKFQRFGEAFASITGDAQGAKDVLEQIRTLADQDAVAFEKMANAGQRMAAIGVDLRDIPGVLNAVADGARAMNTNFDTAQQRFDQVIEQGTLTARSLVALGVTIEDVGAAFDHEGESIAQIRKAFTDYGDTAERAVLLANAIVLKHGEIAQKTADDVIGAWTRIGNALTKANTNIGESLDGWRGLADAVVLSIKIIETAVLGFVGMVKDIVDIVHNLVEAAASAFINLGKAISQAVSGDFVGAALTMQKGWGDLKNFYSNFLTEIQHDTDVTAASLDKVWADHSKSVNTSLGAVKTAAEQATGAIAKAFEGQKQALVDAQAELVRVQAAYEQGAASAGMLKDAQDAVTRAFQAMNPVIKASSDAFGLSIQKAVDAVRAYQEGTGTLAAAQSQINAVLENAALKWDNLTAKNQTATMKLGVMAKDLADIASSQAFDTLMTKITDLGIKYPAAISVIDSATLDFLNSLRGLNALEIKDFSAPVVQALERVLASQVALDSSQKQLNSTLEAGHGAAVKFGEFLLKAFEGGAESAARLAQKIKELGVASGFTGQQIISDVNLMNKMGLETITNFETQLNRWKELADAVTRLNQPLATQLIALRGEAETQLRLNELIGAEAEANLKVQQTITAISLAQFALHQQTMGQADLWKKVADDTSKAFDQLGQSIATAWFNGETGAKALMDSLKKLGEQIVGDLIQGALKDLAAELIRNSGLIQNLGVTATDTVKTATNAITETASAASKSITQIATQAVSSIGSLVSMVSSVVGAITGIIGNIEMAHMEKTLGQIETNTRQAFNALGAGSQSIAGTSLLGSQYLGDIRDTLQGAIVTLLVDISANLDDINSKVGTIGGGDSSGLIGTVADLKGQIQILTEQITQAQNASLSQPTNYGGSNVATGSAAVDYSGLSTGQTTKASFVPTISETLLANIASTVADILEALVTEFDTTVQMTHARAISDAMSGFLNIPLDLISKISEGLPNLMASLNGTAQNLVEGTQSLATVAQTTATASQTLAVAAGAVVGTLGSASTAIATASNAILAFTSVIAPVVFGNQQMLLAQLPTPQGIPGVASGGVTPFHGLNITVNIPGTIVGPGGIDGVTTAVANQLVNKLATQGIRLTRS